MSNPSGQLQTSKDVKGTKYAKDARDPQGSTRTHGDPPETKVLNALRKNLMESGKKRKLDSLGQYIFEDITDTYDDDRGQKEALISALKTFLEPSDDDYGKHMDHCVRWRILLLALKNKKYAEVSKATSETIVETSPMLAFVCLGPGKNDATAKLKRFYVDQCKNPMMHKTEEEAVPFNLAARMGKHTVVNLMLSKLSDILAEAKEQPDHPLNKTTLLELAQAKDGDSRETPLALAQMAKDTPLKTLDELLKVPDITKGDKSFERALENGWDKVVEVFLERGVNTSTVGDFLIEALNKLNEPVPSDGVGDSVRSKESECRLKIVQSLVRRANTPEAFNEKVVEEVIKQNLTQVWKVWKEKSGNGPVEQIQPWLLHMAVLYEKVEFVQIFVDDYPDALSREEVIPGQPDQASKTDKYPLWYNNREWRKGENGRTGSNIPKPPLSDPKESARATIRNLIVTKMIHELDMDKLPDILHRSFEPFDDLCFDISRFNSAAYRISDIVDSLILQDRNNERGMHRYERTLKYVAFPPLDTMVADREVYTENVNLQKDHDEVFRVLDWLSAKKVTKIIKLTVPDRLVNPHDDFKMAEYVKKFKIEVLDWKVLDLSISIFQSKDPDDKEEIREEIKELYLYSSGKRAVIDHWFNKDEGVQSLNKLAKLYVYVIRETCTASQASKMVQHIHIQKQGLVKRNIWSPDPSDVAWYPSPSVADLSRIAYRLSRPLAEWLANLALFVNKRNGAQGMVAHKPTKVAILDNGVLSISPVSKQPDVETSARRNGERAGPEVARGDVLGSKPANVIPPAKKRKQDEENSLWSRIKAGRSFVDGNLNFSPWQFPSDPHGTQMANLICAIDPFCEIYVARVAEDAFGIKAKNVAKAIQWAIDEEVDIISMSFVLGEDPDRVLEDKITAAGKAGIVMTCSTHDEGSRIVTAYPATYKAQCKPLLVLAACDEYGKLLRDIESGSYSYKLRGQNVPAGVVPFIKSEEKISGSSVATALAAGLCSLILTCARLADPNRKFDNKVDILKSDHEYSDSSRIGIVSRHLNSMLSDSNAHYVLLEKFGGIAQPSVGEGVKHGTLNKAGKAGPPSPEMVLQTRFGMKKD